MEEAENTPRSTEATPEGNLQDVKQERDGYFEKLRNWLDDARLWYSLSAGAPSPDVATNNQPQQAQNPHVAFNPAAAFGRDDGLRFRNNQQVPNRNVNGGVPFYQTYPFILPPNLLRLPTTYEFKIPPLWKRLCAELIDFCLLLTLKLGVTFLFMENLSTGNPLDLYGLDVLQKGVLEGEEVNFPLVLELILLEFFHRFFVCAFETFFLCGKTCATPGKRCMGLMVVQVESLTLVPNRLTETVSATGVKAPGWQRALLRSILKNLIVGLLLPLCLGLLQAVIKFTGFDGGLKCFLKLISETPKLKCIFL